MLTNKIFPITDHVSPFPVLHLEPAPVTLALTRTWESQEEQCYKLALSHRDWRRVSALSVQYKLKGQNLRKKNLDAPGHPGNYPGNYVYV